LAAPALRDGRLLAMPRDAISPFGRAPVVSVRRIEDLACALPHLLGFHPVESLVLVAMEDPRDELTFTMRLDLPEPGEVDAVVDVCAARMVAADADGVLAFVVTETPDPADGHLPAAELVEALQRALPMSLRDAFLLRSGRMWSYLCVVPECCPPAGRPVDETSRVSTTLAAAGVVAGRLPARDRDEIVRSAQAVDGAERAAMAAAVQRLRSDDPDEPVDLDVIRQHYLDELPALLARCAERGADVSHDEAALLGCAWHQVDLRDDMLAAIAQGVPGADTLVRGVARLMPPPYDAPAASMLGWVAYAEGSGVLAAAAFERALATDPAYSLASLLADGLDRQVPPSSLRSVWAGAAAAGFAGGDRSRYPPRTRGARRRGPARGR
jgi:hypothetical protein